MRAKACSPGRVREPWVRDVDNYTSPRSGRQKPWRIQFVFSCLRHRCRPLSRACDAVAPSQGSLTRPGLHAVAYCVGLCPGLAECTRLRVLHVYALYCVASTCINCKRFPEG